MKSLKTRILSAAMAGILAVSMAIPAFASSTNIEGSYQDITIAVLVPKTGTAQINPYGLPVKLNTAGQSITGEQIVTKPLAIANQSEVDLAVSATVTASIKGDLKFLEAAPAADDTSKSAFVYLQMKQETTLLQAGLNTEKTGFTDAVLDPAAAAWKQAYNADKDLVLNSRETGASKDNMVFLKKGTAGSDANLMDIVAGGAAMFRLSGAVVAGPREAWTAADGFTSTVAFTFKPDTTAVNATIDKTDLTVTAGANHTAVVTITGLTTAGVNITNVTWAATGSNATVAGSGTNNTTGTITAGSNANTTETITATVTADNGMTYTYTTTVNIAA